MSYPRLTHALLSGLPYFGSALRARQGDVGRQRYFLPALKAALALDRGSAAILEIGSWAGSSAVTWAKGLETLGRDGTVTCVDLWAPYFDTAVDVGGIYVEMNEAADRDDIFKLFLHNIRACGVERYIRPRRGDSREVLKEFADGSFDLVYIDGAHRFDLVKSDIEQAKRLVRDGGIVCGDDLELQRQAIDPAEHVKLLATGRDCVLAVSANSDYHPGVTEAVAESFDEVIAWDGFWAVRKNGGRWAPVELNLADAEIPAHLLSDSPMPVLVEEGYRGFNLVRYDNVFAAPAAIAVADFAVALTHGILPPIQGTTVADVKVRIDGLRPYRLERDYRNYALYFLDRVYGIPARDPFDPTRAAAGRYPVMFHGLSIDAVKAEIDGLQPRLIEGKYKGHNIVLYDRYYGLKIADGPMDIFTEIENGDVPEISGATIDEVKAEIDRRPAKTRWGRIRG